MSKKQKAEKKAKGTPVSVTTGLSEKVQTAVDSVRAAFVSFVNDFTVLNENRADLAPKFIRAFGSWKSETGGSFVAFVRFMVPEVPEDREGYRAHTAYQAANYLRRLAEAAHRQQETPVSAAEKIASRPVTPQRAVAKVIASLLPLLDPSTLDKLWSALQSELRLTEGQITNLQNASQEETPIVTLRAPKGTHVAHSLRVIASVPSKVSEAA